jgi:glycosyltransferase involved in cell wall biosynthesis
MDQKLVVIIPALNEAKTIEAVIRAIPRHISGISQVEVIVIDDGSTDATARLSQAAGATVVEHKQNMGVGAAFHSGIRAALEAGADIIVNIDADGQFNPDDIPTLIAPVQRGDAGFVTTTRFGKKEFFPDMPTIKRWGNQWMVYIINFLTGQKFTDVSCGFRAYSREAALKLVLFGHFTYTQETFIDLTFKNIVMMEIPLKVRGEREFGKSRVASNLWRYGVKSATIIFRAARDYYPFYFFGVPGIGLFVAGLVGMIFLMIHYLQTGQTYPYRSLVPLSGILIIIGFLMFFMSMLADMLHRNRKIQEEILYLNRKMAFDPKRKNV